MAKKTCPNGHIYDPNIYGDQCPLCPAGGASGGHPATQIGSAPAVPPIPSMGGEMHTQINTPATAPSPTPTVGGFAGSTGPTGPTMMRPQEAEPKGAGSSHTIIRRPGQAGPGANQPSRKLVGFLVTFTHDPNGRSYNIYEGRNYIGRDSSSDISVPEDDQMSGKHLSILYRSVDNKFKFRDEQSSNGTFINKELQDIGELDNYDIIRAGRTVFVFIQIPQL